MGCIIGTSKSVWQGLFLIKGLPLIYLSNWRETSRKRLSLSLENGLQVFLICPTVYINFSGWFVQVSSQWTFSMTWPPLPYFPSPASRHWAKGLLPSCSLWLGPLGSGYLPPSATYSQCSGANQPSFLHVLSLLHLSVTRPYPAYTL